MITSKKEGFKMRRYTKLLVLLMSLMLLLGVFAPTPYTQVSKGLRLEVSPEEDFIGMEAKITLTNIGTEPLTIHSVTVTGPGGPTDTDTVAEKISMNANGSEACRYATVGKPGTYTVAAFFDSAKLMEEFKRVQIYNLNVGKTVIQLPNCGDSWIQHSLLVGAESFQSLASGDARIAHDLQVDRNLTVKQDLNVSGKTSLNTLQVNKDLDVLGTLTVAKRADIMDELTTRYLVVSDDLEVRGEAIVHGDLSVSGIKFFVQPHPTDPTKVITYAALEGPEAGTYVRGTAQLVDGEVTIDLPESFRLVTGEEGLTVQVTPLEECNGLYVVEKSPERIVVRELMSGSSNARFDYLVQGVRKGCEDFEPIREKEDD